MQNLRSRRTLVRVATGSKEIAMGSCTERNGLVHSGRQIATGSLEGRDGLIRLGNKSRRQALSRSDRDGRHYRDDPVNVAYRALALTGSAPKSDRRIRAPLMFFQYRALGDAVLATSAAQTCANFPPAFVSSVTWLVTMLAIAFGWSVGYEDLGFSFLAGPLCDVEGTFLAIVWLGR
ncbi:hypothetical protein Taro_021769 [Colocasia esculenta]|uniref:Uncharacterized protein n=1 Tax=Colocasia esculenta TaxID=4460 RepID=A0A843UZX6_COLES|nr:hypothetical protein [Colocasia esculenta]